MCDRVDLLIPQGTDYPLTLIDRVRDFTGYTLRMQGRTSFDDNQTVFSWGTATGEWTIAYASGVSTLTLNVTAAVTALLGHSPHNQAHGISGVYDLEAVSPAGIVTRIMQGTFVVDPEVTR